MTSGSPKSGRRKVPRIHVSIGSVLGVHNPRLIAHRTKRPTPAERAAAWERDDPAELLRAADEWAAIGHTEYAEFLRASARGERVPWVRRPW